MSSGHIRQPVQPPHQTRSFAVLQPPHRAVQHGKTVSTPDLIKTHFQPFFKSITAPSGAIIQSTTIRFHYLSTTSFHHRSHCISDYALLALPEASSAFSAAISSADISPIARPAFLRIAASISARIAEFSRKKLLAFSRPCPSRWLS